MMANMKMLPYTVLLTSLLILGYASAKAFPQEIEPSLVDPNDPTPSVDNNVNFDQSPDAQGNQNNFVLDGNAAGSTTPITLLDTASEVRQYVVSKLQEIYNMLKGCKNKKDIEKATRLDFEHLPQFEEPLYVGNFTKKYKLADVVFSNVMVHGMKNFRSAAMQTDVKYRTVDLSLVAQTLRITGHYFLSNYFKKTSGPFVVRLINNVTYHESSVYCRLNNEIDIAASHCGIRYGKSENDYADLGFFTQIFRSAISNPMIDEVLQKVGKEIGHKMRPVILSKLHETVMGNHNILGLETLIRSSVSEARNLMMRDEYKNFLLEGDTENVVYGTHDASIRAIYLSGINAFEITKLEIPILDDRITVNVTVHDTNVNGSVNIEFVENGAIQPKLGGPNNMVLAFDVADLAVDMTFEKKLSNDNERFFIKQMKVTVNKVTTHPPQNQVYESQVATALRDFVPKHLESIITKRFSAMARTQIDTILQEAF